MITIVFITQWVTKHVFSNTHRSNPEPNFRLDKNAKFDSHSGHLSHHHAKAEHDQTECTNERHRVGAGHGVVLVVSNLLGYMH